MTKRIGNSVVIESPPPNIFRKRVFAPSSIPSSLPFEGGYSTPLPDLTPQIPPHLHHPPYHLYHTRQLHIRAHLYLYLFRSRERRSIRHVRVSSQIWIRNQLLLCVVDSFKEDFVAFATDEVPGAVMEGAGAGCGRREAGAQGLVGGLLRCVRWMVGVGVAV